MKVLFTSDINYFVGKCQNDSFSMQIGTELFTAKDILETDHTHSPDALRLSFGLKNFHFVFLTIPTSVIYHFLEEKDYVCPRKIAVTLGSYTGATIDDPEPQITLIFS